LDEQIDIFSYGNNLYTVLTGLPPFYTTDEKGAAEMVKRGKKPFIDPRWRNNSFAEGKIVELIELCYPFKPEDRITIFEAIKFLREAVAENERRNKRQLQLEQQV
jgi:serine/threonine protein kinase